VSGPDLHEIFLLLLSIARHSIHSVGISRRRNGEAAALLRLNGWLLRVSRARTQM